MQIATDEFPDLVKVFRGNQLPRGHDRAYLIHVHHGRYAKGRLYMPYPSLLKMEVVSNRGSTMQEIIEEEESNAKSKRSG